MNSLIKNLLIILSLALIAFFGYMLLGNDTSMGILVTDTGSGVATVDSDEIRRALNELGSYRIDGELFSDPAFKDLRDFRLNLGTEQTSRKNPFAPI